jgi:hypothetical protein
MARAGTGLLLALAPALVGESAALASDSIGIYAVVKKVKYEPDPQNATALRVRLCGAFAKSRITSGDYFAAEAGYMYYSCPTGQEAMCRMQWGEIEAAGKAGKCIGWGVRRNPQNPSQPNDNGSVRTALPVANPDAYPIGMGTGLTPDMSGGTTACSSAEAGTAGLSTAACDETGMPPAPPTPDPQQPTDPPAETPSQGACALSQQGGRGAPFILGGGLFAMALLALGRRARRRGVADAGRA